MNYKSNRSFLLPTLALLLLLFFVFLRISDEHRSNWQNIISSDGKGYYAYLPALFIHGDLSYRQVSATEKKMSGFVAYRSDYLVNEDGYTLNKYFAGESLLLLPFFIAAMGLTSLSPAPMDGYSFFFQIMAGLGALFYLLAGLWYLFRILRFLRLPEPAPTLSVLLILAGTNLFYYALWQPTMSHTYSFAVNTALVWYWISGEYRNPRLQSLILGLLLGAALLIRPTNLLILLLLPALNKGYPHYFHQARRLFQNKSTILLFISGLFTLLIIQPVLWYLQTGTLLIWPYLGEGFNFSEPQITNMLFSFRKGLFIYTPLLLLSLAGLYPLFRRDKQALPAMVVFLIILIFVTASWWNWYYGDGFGQRSFIDFYLAFAFLLAHLINRMKAPWQKWILIPLLIFITGLTQFQSLQYRRKIIHPFSMDREKYLFVFGKCSGNYVSVLGGNREDPYFGTNTQRSVASFFNNFEKKMSGWNNDRRFRSVGIALSGTWVSRQDSLGAFSGGLKIQADQISGKPRRYYTSVSLSLMDSIAGATDEAFFIVQILQYDFVHDYYYSFRVNDLPGPLPGVWRQCNYSFNLPEMTNPSAILKLYIWNKGKGVFYLEDMKIKFFQTVRSRRTTA